MYEFVMDQSKEGEDSERVEFTQESEDERVAGLPGDRLIPEISTLMYDPTTYNLCGTPEERMALEARVKQGLEKTFGTPRYNLWQKFCVWVIHIFQRFIRGT